jgi:hypothetical protein
MNLSRQNSVAILFITALVAQPGTASAQIAQEAVDLEVVQHIREEGFERSQIEALARYLTEVIGPRLTGSPGMKKANEWTVEMFEEFGLENSVVEPWGEFGRGWPHHSGSVHGVGGRRGGSRDSANLRKRGRRDRRGYRR